MFIYYEEVKWAMKQNLIVLQEGSKDCGAASLLSIIRYYGGDISLDRLIDMTKTTKEGTNFYNLKDAANKMGLMGIGYKVDDISKLLDIKEPFIVQVKVNNFFHFVVVYRISDNKVLLMDPSVGKVTIDLFDFSSMWTGYIMLFEKGGDVLSFKTEKVINKILLTSIRVNIKCILFVCILTVIFTSLSCFVSLYSQVVFDRVIDSDINNLVVVTIFFSILFIVKAITNFIRNYLLIYLNIKLDISVILSTFSKVILLPYKYYKNKTTSEVLSRINDLSNVKNFISKIIVVVFLDVLFFIMASIVILSINIKIYFLLVSMSLLYFIIIIIFSPIIKRVTINNQEKMAYVNNFIVENVSSFETIKGLNIESDVIFDFDRIYSKMISGVFYSEKINNIMSLFKNLIEDLGLFFVSYFAIRCIMNGNLTVGNYLTISLLSGYIIYPFRNILDIMREYYFIKNTITRGNNLLDVSTCEDSSNGIIPLGDITIKNLSYTYDNKYMVLHDANFFINRGEKVVIIGSSGSGKSTLLKLIYKYFECERDKIFIDGYDINDYSIYDIRKNIVYVSQNEMLYTKTIRDNILLGRNIDEKEYLNIIKICHIDEIIGNNPLGDKFVLEENGVNISGGQRQRIILARSLIKGSNIIMIDEGFNQIDINLERVILKNIFDYYRDKTIIVISHREDNCYLYDRMIRFCNDGVIKNLERVVEK